ncbi:nuclear transport factor 2 family protein [Anaerorhabdus furcosa]|uniref:Putative lumazine-binding n=1 Tax=Anaerorhabdus furcosa TaxID=118967 RepID=A0A1T4LYB0_9FIRM|nr:nuclear transport factor 2 family protein [Anaerorhabdus furcosa]SJZ59723.1 Putative lumazine-binding [Anaerorhabdus furcosa]
METRREKSIRDLLEQYFDAISNADVVKLKTIFHPNASMYGYLGDQVVVGTPEIFYADLNSKPSMIKQNIKCTCVVDSIQVISNTATASILVDNFYGVATVNDSFHLIKFDNEWKIVCKTFTTL